MKRATSFIVSILFFFTSIFLHCHQPRSVTITDREVIPLGYKSNIPHDLQDEIDCISEAVGFTMAAKSRAYVGQEEVLITQLEGKPIYDTVPVLIIERTFNIIEKQKPLPEEQKKEIKQFVLPQLDTKYSQYFKPSLNIPKRGPQISISNDPTKLFNAEIAARQPNLSPVRAKVNQWIDERAREASVVKAMINKFPDYANDFANRLDGMVHIFHAINNGTLPEQVNARLQIPHIQIEGIARDVVDNARIILQDRYFDRNGRMKFPFAHDGKIGEVAHEIFKRTCTKDGYKKVLKGIGDSSSRQIIDHDESNFLFKGICAMGRVISAPFRAIANSSSFPSDICSSILNNTEYKVANDIMEAWGRASEQDARRALNTCGTSMTTALFDHYYQPYRNAIYSSDGIKRAYLNDPKWNNLSDNIKCSISGNQKAQDAYNEFLGIRYGLQKQMRSNYKISEKGSQEIEDTIYQAIEILNVYDQASFLLSKSKESSAVGRAFTDSRGLLKEYANDKILESVPVDKLNEKQKELLHHLLVARKHSESEEQKNEAYKAVEYLLASANFGNCHYGNSYNSLAECVARMFRNGKANPLFEHESFLLQSENISAIDVHGQMLDVLCNACNVHEKLDTKKHPVSPALLRYIIGECANIQNSLIHEENHDAKKSLLQLQRLIFGSIDVEPDLIGIAHNFDQSLKPISWHVINELAQINVLELEQKESQAIDKVLGAYSIDGGKVLKQPETFAEHLAKTKQSVLAFAKRTKQLGSKTVRSLNKENTKRLGKKLLNISDKLFGLDPYPVDVQLVKQAIKSYGSLLKKHPKSTLKKTAGLAKDVLLAVFERAKEVVPIVAGPTPLKNIDGVIDQDNVAKKMDSVRRAGTESVPEQEEELFDLFERYRWLSLNDESKNDRTTYSMRARSLQKTLNDPNKIIAQKLFVSNKTRQLLMAHNVAPYLFERVSGNSAQLRAYSECATILNESAELLENGDNIEQVEDVVSSIVEFSEASRQSTQVGKVERSFVINDTSSALLKYVRGFVRGVGKGVINVGKMAIHPVETVKNLGQGLIQASCLLMQLLSHLEDDSVTEFFVNRVEDRTKDAAEHVEQLLKTLKEKYNSTPGPDLTEQVVTVVTEQIALATLAGVLKNFWSKGAQSLARLKRTSKSVIEVPESMLLQPHANIVQNSSKQIIEKAGKEDILRLTRKVGNKLKKGVAAVEEEFVELGAKPKSSIITPAQALLIPKKCGPLPVKELVRRKAVFETILKEGLKKIKTPKELYERGIPLFKGIDIEHIIKGGYKADGKKIKGFHTMLCHPEQIIELLEGPNDFGICKARWWFGKGKTRPSTFFPITWDEEKLAYKILEALDNIKKLRDVKTAIKLAGETSDGISVLFTSNNSGFIETSYPSLLKISEIEL
ncbi:EndoU domain-containing protein [bacterium]|nr:EndoU domain-containing protein [bacterium]